MCWVCNNWAKTAISVSEITTLSVKKSYVGYVEDYSTNTNGPKWRVYAVGVHGIGGSTLFNIKYGEVLGNLPQKNISVDYMTVLSVGHYFNRDLVEMCIDFFQPNMSCSLSFSVM